LMTWMAPAICTSEGAPPTRVRCLSTTNCDSLSAGLEQLGDAILRQRVDDAKLVVQLEG